VDDADFMRMAIEEAQRCQSEDQRVHPMVGVIVGKGQELLAHGYRGELSPGEHAEYTVLERKLGQKSVAGCTVYTTLEPCTTRNHAKIPCAERLIERKVARVVIGMLDPNPTISGKGQQTLRSANITTDFFRTELMAQVEELNRAFIRSHRANMIPPSVRSLREQPNKEPDSRKLIRDCRFCVGSAKDPYRPTICRICNGDGRVNVEPDCVDCRYCKGSARDPYNPSPCPKCAGMGLVKLRSGG